MKILDLGCGKKKYKGKSRDKVIGLDKFKLSTVDVVHDLEKTPLPFRNNEFDMVYASHVLEHIHNIIPLIEEVHRILKPSGKFVVITPHFSWNLAYGDLTHCRVFSVHSFDHFLISNKKLYDHHTKARFKLNKIRIDMSVLYKPIQIFVNIFPSVWEKTFLKSLFPGASINFELEAIK